MSLKEWNTVNWQLVEKRLFRYQRRIYEASKRGDKHKVKGLQKKILFSLDAKLMAVRVATNNYETSKNVETNSILYVTTAEKVKLVAKLRIDSKAHSIKKLNLDKYVFKTFTLEDGAKETLCLLALEPEWEAKFENDFYGPRPGRSRQDALNFIQQCFNNKKNQQKLNQFVLNTEVGGHLDKLNPNLA
jgi:RNA-directed DNA polymerase